MNCACWQWLRFLRTERFSNIKDYVTKSLIISKFLVLHQPQNIVAAASICFCFTPAITLQSTEIITSFILHLQIHNQKELQTSLHTACL